MLTIALNWHFIGACWCITVALRPCCSQGSQCQKCKDSLHVVNDEVDNYSLEERFQLNTQVQIIRLYIPTQGCRILVAYGRLFT